MSFCVKKWSSDCVNIIVKKYWMSKQSLSRRQNLSKSWNMGLFEDCS